jgi:hypothetical protein
MSSAAAADVVKEFLTKIDVTCKSSEHKLLTCNIDNILVTNCRNATIQCENMSTATKVLCDPAKTVQDIANLVADKIKTAADKAALSKNLKSTPIPETGDRPLIIQRVTQHLTQECVNEITARQTMDFPLIALSNCNNVLITALNRLDTKSTCALGVATDLLRGVGMANSPSPKPSSNGNQDPPSGLPVSYIALIVIGVAVLGIIAYALYRSRQPLPSPSPSPAATAGGPGGPETMSATKAGKSA